MAEGPDLGKKVGPLPMGVWIVVVAGALGIAYFMNKRSANAAPELSQLAESGVGVGAGGFVSGGGGGGGGGSPAVDDTNQAWSLKAINYLISLGSDPTDADYAVRKYVSGQALTFAEKAKVNMALTKFGPPPEGISGPPVSGPPSVIGLTAALIPNANDNEILVTWLPSAGATSYYVSQDSGGDSEISVTGAQARWLVSPNKTVTFTVIARNDYGDSEPRSTTIYSGPVPLNRRSEKPPTQPSSPAPGAGQIPARTYTVRDGDQLQIIAAQQLGNGAEWRSLYNRNIGVIEGAAKMHGQTSSRGPTGIPGWYLYAGTQLVLE